MFVCLVAIVVGVVVGGGDVGVVGVTVAVAVVVAAVIGGGSSNVVSSANRALLSTTSLGCFCCYLHRFSTD